MSLTAAQLEMRKTGIGGSEIAAILGESRFATPFDVWLSKTQGWVLAETEDMKRGSFLEDGIARWYADRFGLTSERPGDPDFPVMYEPGTIRHATIPVALCTPDRTLGRPGSGRLLSIKAPRRGGGLWGEPGTDSVPPEYLLQLQWEWAICDSIAPGSLGREMHLAALIDGDLAVYIVQADAEIQAWMLDYAASWWATHVQGAVAPPMDGSSQAREWLKRKFPANASPVRPATAWEDLRMLTLRDAEREAKKCEAEAETIRNELKSTIGTAAGIAGPAGIITWKADVNGKRSFKPKWTKEQS